MRLLSLLALAGSSVAATTATYANTTASNDTAAAAYDVTSQVRLAFHGATGMVVSWNTYTQLAAPTVRYGRAPDALTSVAAGNVSVTYPTSLTYNNHVWLDGLQPDTTYYYQPDGLLPREAVAGPYSFKTARAAGDDAPFSLAFVCDMGTMGPDGLSDVPNKKTDANEVLRPGEQTTIGSLAALVDTYDFVVHPGDLAYADAWLKEERAGYLNDSFADGPQVYERILNGFYDEMEVLSAFRPYMIGVGNHEADCDNGGNGPYNASICVEGQTNFTGVINHFRMPADLSGGVGNFWYSFDYGMAHFVFFDTETDLGGGRLQDEADPFFAGPFGRYPDEQVDWLRADLAAVDRCATPWVVALGHRPWFASGDVLAAGRTAFAPLFEELGVDVVLQGHFHVYERNRPVFANGTLDPAGYRNPAAPWYLINGLGGHWAGMDSFTTPLQDYHAFGLDDADATYGWSRLTFHNRTHLAHQFVASANNSVLDETVLYKEHVCLSASSSSSSSSVAASSSSSSTSATSTASLTSASVSESAAPCPSDESSAASSPSASASVSVTTSASSESAAPCPSDESSASTSASATTSATTSASASASVGTSVSVSESPCPSDVSASESASAAVSGSAAASATPSSSSWTTATLLSTTTYTITSCAATVTDCPVGRVTTEVVTAYTTYCPETASTAVGTTAGTTASTVAGTAGTTAAAGTGATTATTATTGTAPGSSAGKASGSASGSAGAASGSVTAAGTTVGTPAGTTAGSTVGTPASTTGPTGPTGTTGTTGTTATAPSRTTAPASAVTAGAGHAVRGAVGLLLPAVAAFALL